MTTYAILGATGQAGSGLVRLLLPTSAHLNIYARSQTRLETKFPSLSSAPNVTLFIGDLSDTALLTSCLSNADIVLSTVAQNQNEPGCSIAQQTALAIVRALEPKRAEGTKCPTLVFLGSASIDPHNPHNAELGARILHWTLYHVYTDLEEAIELLRANPFIPLVVACAAGLVHDIDHHVQITDEPDKASPLLSYSDLAKAMVAMGDEGNWAGKYAYIRVNEGKAIGGNPLALLRYLIPNFLGSACPLLWRLGKGWWPV